MINVIKRYNLCVDHIKKSKGKKNGKKNYGIVQEEHCDVILYIIIIFRCKRRRMCVCVCVNEWTTKIFIESL